MKTIADTITRFLLSEDGPTAVEYAVLLGLIFLTALVAVDTLGMATSGSFDGSAKSIKAVL